MDNQPRGLIGIIKSLFSQKEIEQFEKDPHRYEPILLEKTKQFFDTTVKEVMVPRTKMVTIEQDASVKDAIQIINTSGHSRIPVQNQVPDNIVGVLYAKDLFQYIATQETTQIKDIMRRHYYAPYSQQINDLLTRLKALRVHLAIVVDEYGGVAGLVTIEDLIEEILGEIEDEFDQPSKAGYKVIGSNTLMMEADFELDEFNQLYKTSFEKEGIETIGGYICFKLGKIPTENEVFDIENLNFTVVERDDRSLIKLKVISTPPKK